MKTAYPVILKKEGTDYLVHIPDFNIDTEGCSLADAIYMAGDAIGIAGIALEEQNKKIPLPSKELPKVDENSIAQFVVVDFEEYKKANDMKAVRKNVTIPSYLNRLAIKAGLSFSQILQDGIKHELFMQ